MATKIKQIVEELHTKAALKQRVYDRTKSIFDEFREVAVKIAEEIVPQIRESSPAVEVKVDNINDFEFHLKFSGDTIVFVMHTNTFTFPPEHEVIKSKYVQTDSLKGYFGMIQAYNFLSDSLKYHRYSDAGYLLARIFVNEEEHFYVDGHRQLGFLFKELAKQSMDKRVIRKIIEQSMLYCIDFDLYAPPVDSMTVITLNEKDAFNNPNGLATGKRLGFVLD